jgi:hypothetical protein
LEERHLQCSKSIDAEVDQSSLCALPAGDIDGWRELVTGNVFVAPRWAARLSSALRLQ